MAATFFFYDLETSGFNPRHDRVMQFAGQRTDLSLKPVGEPFNELITMTPDILPDPGAIMITGITPQQTIQDGWTEAGFMKVFNQQIATPDTIFVGFNSIRFDDEFMRCLHYRNFYDPYEWEWRDGRGRWDMLDVVRMTRALRPDGIEWPMAAGKPTNRLELLTKANGLNHDHAHDALSDVYATIAVAQLIKDQQPKLFDWLFKARTKDAVKRIVEDGQPFVYTSGKYSGQFGHTTVAVRLSAHPGGQGSLVYDLRFDPTEFLTMAPAELADRWRWQKDRTDQPLPVKTLQYNRCPAIAPLSVLDDTARERLQLPTELIAKHRALLNQSADLVDRLHQALKLLDADRALRYPADPAVDGQLYDSFLLDADRPIMAKVPATDPADLSTDQFKFRDKRLNRMLPLYKSRNFPASLSTEERAVWEDFRIHKLLAGDQRSPLAKYFSTLQTMSQQPGLSTQQSYLLEELQLYGQSIMPSDVSD